MFSPTVFVSISFTLVLLVEVLGRTPFRLGNTSSPSGWEVRSLGSQPVCERLVFQWGKGPEHVLLVIQLADSTLCCACALACSKLHQSWPACRILDMYLDLTPNLSCRCFSVLSIQPKCSTLHVQRSLVAYCSPVK